MFTVLSAEAVARRVMSGENLRDVIPRAWAREMVIRGTKLRDFGFSAVRGMGEGECERERSREDIYDLDLDLERRLD